MKLQLQLIECQIAFKLKMEKLYLVFIHVLAASWVNTSEDLALSSRISEKHI